MSGATGAHAVRFGFDFDFGFGFGFGSIRALIPPLATLIGESAARDAARKWLGRALAARFDDDEAARRHANYAAAYPNAVADDFRPKIVETSGGRALLEARFFGGAPERPFVEAIAWDDGVDRAALADVARWTFAVFKPEALRRLQAGLSLVADDRLDQSVHVARLDGPPPPRGRVRAPPVDDVDAALSMIVARYARVREETPDLGARIGPEDREGLMACAADGVLRWIVDADDDAVAGVFAAKPGRIAFIDGLVVHEEVVSPERGGRGLASDAQRTLAAEARDAPKGPLRAETLLIGTIDALNAASRRAAVSAGRPALYAYVFQPLRRLPSRP